MAQFGGDGEFAGSISAIGATVGVACTAAITGNRTGSLVLRPGSTCLSKRHVNGSVSVLPGSALDGENSTITGSLGADGSVAVRLCRSINGPKTS